MNKSYEEATRRIRGAIADAYAASAAISTPTGAASAVTYSSDRTEEFRSILKRHQKADQQATGSSSLASTANSILPHIHKLTPFTKSALHLSEYLDLHRFVSDTSSLRQAGGSTAVQRLTDSDRDELEQEVSRSTLQINEKIDALKASIPEEDDPEDEDDDDEDEATAKLTPEQRGEQRAARNAQRRLYNNPDLRAHQHTLIILLVDSLKSLVQLMSTLKQQRVERMKKDVQERFPEELKRRKAKQPAAAENKGDGSTTSETEETKSSDLFGITNAVSKGLKKLGVGEKLAAEKQILRASPILPEDDAQREDRPVLTPLEQSQLLEENRHLLDSLEENLDQIRRAESKMSEIADLLTLFTTKVVEQEEQINSIYDHAIKSTLHVHSGIAQLKKAAQRGVTFRMMIMFMILMLSFSLLFLDWYMT